MTRICEKCGKEFEERNVGLAQRFCSLECSHRHQHDIAEWRRTAGKTERQKAVENMKKIVALDKLAKKEGMSYGQYVSRYGL